MSRKLKMKGKNPEHAVWSPDGKWLYVSAEEADSLYIVDLASGKVKAADLPPPPTASGDPSKDYKLIGITRVSRAVYDKTRVGEELLVANVPWNTAGPVLVDEINAYTPAPYYPWIAGLLILTVVLFLLGRRVGRAG